MAKYAPLFVTGTEAEGINHTAIASQVSEAFGADVIAIVEESGECIYMLSLSDRANPIELRGALFLLLHQAVESQEP